MGSGFPTGVAAASSGQCPQSCHRLVYKSFPQSILLLLLNCILFPSDDSLRQEYPFTLKLVQKDGSWCSRCEWHRFCRGCPLPCSNSGFAFASSYLAIDWDQTALHLRYLPTQERVRFTVWIRLYFTFVFVAWDFSFMYRRTEPIQACQALSKLRPNQSPSTSALKPSQGRKSWEPTRNTTAHHVELTSWLSRNCKSGDFHLSWYTGFFFCVYRTLPFNTFLPPRRLCN